MKIKIELEQEEIVGNWRGSIEVSDWPDVCIVEAWSLADVMRDARILLLTHKEPKVSA